MIIRIGCGEKGRHLFNIQEGRHTLGGIQNADQQHFEALRVKLAVLLFQIFHFFETFGAGWTQESQHHDPAAKVF